MLGACLVLTPHQIHQVLESVEWDTLLFFAALFVLVETIAEMGLIRAIGSGLESIIVQVPLESRLPVAMVLFLWVSAIGSAFLESLPYTTTIACKIAVVK